MLSVCLTSEHHLGREKGQATPSWICAKDRGMLIPKRFRINKYHPSWTHTLPAGSAFPGLTPGWGR